MVDIEIQPVVMKNDTASSKVICVEEESSIERLPAGNTKSQFSEVRSGYVDAKDLISTPVYYVFGDALFDMLLLLGILFGTAFWTFGLIMHQKSILFGMVLGLFLIDKIACCVIGYIAIRRCDRLFYFITIAIAVVGLIIVVYMFSKAFTAFFDSIGLEKIFVFFATMVELFVLIHIIYYCIKLM